MSGSQVSQPAVSITIANADATVQNTDQRVLIVGQQTAAASALDGALTINISSSGAPEDALFGQDSQLAAMIRAFKKVNKVVRIDAIGLDDDGSGVPRVVDFTVLGTATAAGSVTVVAGSEKNHKFVVAVAVGDTATVVGGNITTAVNADLDVPFTASNTAGAVTRTAVNDGTVANDLGVEAIVAAVGLTLSVQVVETTAGATDPTLTGVLDVATLRYQGVVWPYEDTTVVAAYLLPRRNPTNDILDGVSFTTIQDTHSNALVTLNALNNQDLVHFVDKQESIVPVAGLEGYLGPAQNEASYVKSSIFAAIRSLRLTQDESIASLVTSGASLDQFGGPALASLPYFNTPLEDLPLIPAGRGWTVLEIEQLFDAGGAVMGVNTAGNTAITGEVVTTYKTDAASNPDPTFQLLNYVDTQSRIRDYRWNNLKARFAQSRLTEGSVSRGRDMANSVVIRAFVEKLYQDLAGPGFVLVQDGAAAIAFYKDNLTIILDLSTGKVTITDLTPIVTQLRQIIMTMKITFSVTV